MYLRMFAFQLTNRRLKNQRSEIFKYANEKKLGSVEFIEETVSGRKSWKEREIGALISKLRKGGILIITELSRLGRSMPEIMELLSILLRAGVELHVVESRQILKDDLQSKKFSSQKSASFVQKGT